MADRVLPHDLEAERSVLACLLLEPRRFPEIADALVDADFFRDAHQRVFRAIAALYGRRGGIDLVTARAELQLTGDLDAVGGSSYLAGLIEGNPRGVNLPHYARLVREASLRRRLIAEATTIAREAYASESTTEELIADAERRILAIGRDVVRGDFVPATEWMADTGTHVERLMADPRDVTGIATGFLDLDLLTRGLQPGDLIILGARPGMGKTAFASQIALHAAQAVSVGFFSVEMSRLSLGLRAIASSGRISSGRLQRGQLKADEIARFHAIVDTLGRRRLWLDDSPILTAAQLRTKARRLKAQHGLDLLIIDYLQILEPPSGKARAENRTLELAAMSRSLKQLAKELHAPIVVLSQLSRRSEDRSQQRPVLADLRESGAIEQDADLVWLLHRAEYYQASAKPEDKGKATVIVAKHRNGPIGDVDLNFDAKMTRFDNRDTRSVA